MDIVKNKLSSMKQSIDNQASSAKGFVKEKASSALNSVKSMLGKEEKGTDEEGEENKQQEQKKIDLVKEGKQVLTDFSKSAINGAIEEIKNQLENKLKYALNEKKSEFQKIILAKIDARMNAPSIQNYLKQMNPSYDLSNHPEFGGSGSKYIKRKRKTKKNPKRIQKKAKNNTKKRQQGGNLLKHALVEYFSQPSGKIEVTITSSLGKTNLSQVLQSAITNVMISFPEYPQNQTEIEDAMKGVMKRIFDKKSSEDIKKAILSEKCAKHIQ